MCLCVCAPTGQFEAFSQAIGKVRKDYHHTKLQRRSLSQIKVFQKLISELGNLNMMKDSHTHTHPRTHTRTPTHTGDQVSLTHNESGYKSRDESSEGSKGSRAEKHF